MKNNFFPGARALLPVLMLAFCACRGAKPGSPEAAAGRARLFGRFGLHTQAAKEYTKAIGVSTGSADLYLARGGEYFAAGEYEKDLGDYFNTLGLEHEWGMRYFAGRKPVKDVYEKLAQDYSDALAASPKDPRLYALRGAANYRLLKFNESLADYNCAIAYSSGSPAAYYSARSTARAVAGAPGEMDDLFKAMGTDPEDRKAYYLSHGQKPPAPQVEACAFPAGKAPSKPPVTSVRMSRALYAPVAFSTAAAAAYNAEPARKGNSAPGPAARLRNPGPKYDVPNFNKRGAVACAASIDPGVVMKVTDEAGTVLDGVVAVLRDGRFEDRMAITPNYWYGNYLDKSFSPAPGKTYVGARERAGTYKLTVSKKGYGTLVRTVTVVRSNVCHVTPTTLTLVLKKSK